MRRKQAGAVGTAAGLGGYGDVAPTHVPPLHPPAARRTKAAGQQKPLPGRAYVLEFTGPGRVGADGRAMSRTRLRRPGRRRVPSGTSARVRRRAGARVRRRAGARVRRLAGARVRRLAAALAGTIGALALLSGCGAELRPLAAVYLDASGGPWALVRPCGDDLVQGLGLRGTPAAAADDEPDSASGLSGWRVPGERHIADAAFPLFSPPAAWRARPAGRQRLVPGYTYELGFMKAEYNYEYTGLVTFRAADLRRLGPGRVWAEDRAMSLGEFERLAEDSC
ncbi:hypothetical protein ACFV0T_23750 [Streptomyces sp. NPDC059582]|uniref:hypothetical protein n=1 Tax=Streptomyces sp. NPDC059582 TaxID=3346875 RepID=UPI0036A9D7F0